MKHDKKHIQDLCKQHMHAYVLAETNDGRKIDGIITGLDDEYVYIAIPIDQSENQPYRGNDERQFGYGYGYGYPGPYYHGGYGRPRRRFNRLVLPLAALTALSILPWY
ncbi:hypothetical protein CFK37_00610 [Virgibacillus phasianinus]|uniref:Phosphatidylinositol kinase n=1 Tax=Virgibacillus phasianinus TaxID=2017483 RepID=A0A220U885_9BACI|nr:hypothetical protein [Virgibacillus phasianinus]ASK64245.1 hypothetical protein CFK37_00610 [Virgibacillus phasianinus]